MFVFNLFRFSVFKSGQVYFILAKIILVEKVICKDSASCIIYSNNANIADSADMRGSKPLPTLNYIELHLSDICQLNCKGCSHFAPIFYNNGDLDLTCIIKDFRHLGSVFANIRTIRLMGGEPFLCMDAVRYAEEIRKIFPRSDISIVTNGILFSAIRDEELQRLEESAIMITLSDYGVADLRQIQRIKRSGVSFNMTSRINSFMKFFSEERGDKYANFRDCYVKSCTFYRNSKLYLCAAAALIYRFNEFFSTAFPVDSGIPVSDIKDGYKVLEWLSNPCELCAFCNNHSPFRWQRTASGPEKTDWI